MSSETNPEAAAREAALAEGIDPETGELLPGSEPDPDDGPDEDDAPAGEPAGEPAEAGAPPPTPEQIEARTKAWERERDRHMRELQKRDEYRYEVSDVCPLCEGHGLFMAALPEPHATGRKLAVMAVLGAAPEPELEPDPDTEACARCGAAGMMKTGSKVQGQEKRVCTACNGQGWRLKATEQWQPPVLTSVPTPPQPFGVTPPQPGYVPPPGYQLVPVNGPVQPIGGT